MGSYRTFVHYIGVIRPKIRVKNEISRFLKFLSSSTSRLCLLDLTPDSSSGRRQLLRAYFRSKRAKWEVYELDPPPFGTSAENTGTHDLIRYLICDVWEDSRATSAMMDVLIGEQKMPEPVRPTGRYA